MTSAYLPREELDKTHVPHDLGEQLDALVRPGHTPFAEVDVSNLSTQRDDVAHRNKKSFPVRYACMGPPRRKSAKPGRAAQPKLTQRIMRQTMI